MTVYDLRTMQRCDISDNVVLALGTFDGCHEGHRAIFGAAKRLAIKLKAKSGIYTFSSIPNSSTLSKKSIFTLDEKIKFMQKTGLDYLIVDDFERVKDMSGEEFFNNVLYSRLKCIGVACGYNYRFGKNAKSSAEDLLDYFKKVGGSVEICQKISYDDKVVSSSLIRSLIEDGEVEYMLNFSDPYSIYAPVEYGKQLGRAMGTPTINQHIPSGKASPKKGVYITECEIGEDVYPSVTNIGMRPTVDGDDAKENAETHIIGFSGDLYSSYIKVNFYKYLRPEMKFSSISIKNS